MKYVMLFFMSLLVTGCKEKNSPKIEVYLLKERQPFVNAVPFNKTSKYKEIDYKRAQDIFEDSQYDTLINEVIFAGEFDAVTADLQSEPFIEDDEIKGFDINGDRLIVNADAAKKIYKRTPEKNFGEQFVITVDKEPKVSGYFWNTTSAINCRWYYIECISPTDQFKNNNNDKTFPVFSGKYNKQITITGLHRHRELLEALEETHRLVK